jgi:UDP-3-O-[3-hydroxymyristoyl] glucosamine N-acyltransferase
MGYKLKSKILLSKVANKLNLEFKGVDLEVRGVAPFSDYQSGELSFTKDLSSHKANSALVVPHDTTLEELDSTGYILSSNPRLDFIRVLSYLEDAIGFATYDLPSEIHPSARIGQNVVIEDGCKIAEGVVIEHNVVIHSGTIIGKNSRIRSCSSIGGDGFGFERMSDGVPVRFPHLGRVRIGENVELGALNSVARGSLSDTVISDYVKTDNLVHIAHNCVLKTAAFLTACAELSGGVIVGERAWIGPNVSVMQKVSIGNDSLLGLGAVIRKNVGVKETWAGNPAKKLS